MKPIPFFFILSVFFSTYGFGQELETTRRNVYDPGFHSYLNEARIACLNKDTLQLHKVFGDEAFGMSCFGLEGVDRNYSNDWETFKAHFKLLEKPEQSGFWDLFLRLSNNGFYYDSIFNTYEVPSSHVWGSLDVYVNGNQLFYAMPVLQQMFYADTVVILVGNELITSKPMQLVPQKRGDQKYPYEFIEAENGFYICLENGKRLGFVSSKDIIHWNLHFSFEKKDQRWILYGYETCIPYQW